jgi:hypothetical protein
MRELYLLFPNVFMAWKLINKAQGELDLYAEGIVQHSRV